MSSLLKGIFSAAALGLGFAMLPSAAHAQCGDCYETPPGEITQHCIDEYDTGCGVDPGDDGGEIPPGEELVYQGIVACDNEIDTQCHHALRSGGCSHHFNCPLEPPMALNAVYTALEADNEDTLRAVVLAHEGVRYRNGAIEVLSCDGTLLARIESPSVQSGRNADLSGAQPY